MDRAIVTPSLTISLTVSDPASNREYYIDTKTGQSHWQIPSEEPLTKPTGGHPHPAFHSDNVIPTQSTEDMDETEVADRGFASDMAMNMVKSKISGGKSKPPPGPLDQVGNLLSSVLGGGNNQTAAPTSKTGSGVGGIVSSLLSGKQNPTSQSPQNNSNSQQGSGTDFGGIISSFLGGGNQNTNQSTQNTSSKPQQGGTDYAGMVSSFLGGGNQNTNQSSHNQKPQQPTTDYAGKISSFLGGGTQNTQQSTSHHSGQEADLSNLPSSGDLLSSLFGGGKTSGSASQPVPAPPPPSTNSNKFGSSDLAGKFSGALGGVAASFSGKKQDQGKPGKQGKHSSGNTENQDPEYAHPVGGLPGSFPVETNAQNQGRQHGQQYGQHEPQTGYGNAPPMGPPQGNPYEHGHGQGGQQNVPPQHQYGQPEPPQVYPTPQGQQTYGQGNPAP